MYIRIIVATHKEYRMPAERSIYLPLHAGKALAETAICGFAGDDTGDNISRRNRNFCELTALYWAWRNLDADYIGLCHYRRYFALSGSPAGRDRWHRIADYHTLETMLLQAPVLLPRKRNYFIESTRSQYIHAHHAADLEVTESVIKELCPEYLEAWHRVMASTSGHRFNMLVMRYDIFDRYMTWLFTVLFEVEKRLDISNYTPYDARAIGFLGERLLDVWLLTEGTPYRELPVVNMEDQRWVKKISGFLCRKFTGGRWGRH